MVTLPTSQRNPLLLHENPSDLLYPVALPTSQQNPSPLPENSSGLINSSHPVAHPGVMVTSDLLHPVDSVQLDGGSDEATDSHRFV